MSQSHAGRHRSSEFSALGELAGIASRSARPAVKASALAVASGGLIASFAVPANAAPQAAPTAGNLPAKSGAAETGLFVAPQVTVQNVVAQAPLASAETAHTPATLAAAVAPAVVPAVNPGNDLEALSFKATKPANAAVMQVSRLQITTVSRSTSRAIPPPSAGILAIAASLSGIPYVYGGESLSGFDCSGFTQYVYRKAGITIPRTAEQQRQAAVKVSNPAPGDLVFFGFPAYHVAIYAGPGKIYEAEQPGTVTGLHSVWTTTNVSYGRF